MYSKWFFIVFLATVESFRFGILPFWYPILPTRELDKKKIHKIQFHDEPYVCYTKPNDTYIIHTDVCPHQGASFSEKGFVNDVGNLQCGYHGFEFCDGNFCKIPNPSKNPKYFRSRITMDTYPVQKNKDCLFFQPIVNVNTPEIFYPPEEADTETFRGVEGYRFVDNHYLSVCENLLDMLHISYVHSFGSQVNPIPIDIKPKKLGEFSFQTQFHYFPNENTISTKVGSAPKVIVQNEYHLPTNTVTRVFAGNVIKTVFTRAIPISYNKTMLYWKIYRNFWLDPYFPIFNVIGDVLIRFLMEKTIDEDVDILKSVYDDKREGPLTTKYDITILNFRKDIQKFMNTTTEIETKLS